MSDDLHDLLVRTADRPNRPLDAASLVGRAHRRKRATRAAVALGVTAVVAVASVAALTTLDRTGPRLEITADPDGDERTGDEGSAAELWDRVFVSEERLIDGEPRPLLDGTEFRLTFASGPAFERQEGDLSIDHDAEGHLIWDACNTGRQPLEVDGGRLQLVGSGRYSDIFCPEEMDEQDGWLGGFLASDPSWELQGDQLTLSTQEATLVLREDPGGEPFGSPSDPLD